MIAAFALLDVDAAALTCRLDRMERRLDIDELAHEVSQAETRLADLLAREGEVSAEELAEAGDVLAIRRDRLARRMA